MVKKMQLNIVVEKEDSDDVVFIGYKFFSPGSNVVHFMCLKQSFTTLEKIFMLSNKHSDSGAQLCSFGITTHLFPNNLCILKGKETEIIFHLDFPIKIKGKICSKQAYQKIMHGFLVIYNKEILTCLQVDLKKLNSLIKEK